MRQNKLQLNDEKTEFCIFLSYRSTFDTSNIKLVLDDVTIDPTVTLKNLGVIFDPALNMSSQVSSIVKRVSYHLRNLSRIRRHLDQDTCKRAVQSLLFSRIDNGNALLFGATEYDLTRLQRLQNRAARLIFQAGPYTSSDPLLRRLHWLPIRKRIDFKLLVLMYKCLHELAPTYLQELITSNTPGYDTRKSLDTTLLLVPRTRTLTWGDKAFQAAGPTLWNDLPKNIRQATSLATFKKLLKTHLYR